MANNKDLDKVAKELNASVDKGVKEALELITHVVTSVEKYKKKSKSLTGKDKQEVAVKVLSERIKLPFPLSMFKGLIFKLAINYIVGKLNKAKGKNWVKKK